MTFHGKTSEEWAAECHQEWSRANKAEAALADRTRERDELRKHLALYEASDKLVDGQPEALKERTEDQAAIRALLDLYAGTRSEWILAWDTVRSRHAPAIARASQGQA